MSRKMVGILTVVLVLFAAALPCLVVGSSLRALADTEAAVERLTEQTALLDDEAVRRQRNLARWYNWNLTAKQADEGFEEAYSGILDLREGMMGYLEIPETGQRLPIYHGVEEASQTRGVGHLPGSAFPVGGNGNHTVLMGTDDFGKLREGELFYIHVLDMTLVYAVTGIREVSPGQTAGLSPSAGEDLCTLVTTRGYGPYTRKLMIRGSRLEPEAEQEAIALLEQKPDADGATVFLTVGAALAVLLLPVTANWLRRGAVWTAEKIYCRTSTKKV